jgi:hypothetical protein
VPNSRDEAGNYYLQLTPTRSALVNACSFCGGHDLAEDGGLYQGGELCSCGSVAGWAADPELPVTYNEQLNVYEMPGYFFHFCVVCGGQMREFERDSLFAPWTDADDADFRARTEKLKSLEDVIAAFGPPDAELGPMQFSEEDKEIYGQMDVKRTLIYAHVWKSLRAYFQEMEDGTLKREYLGKRIRRDSK